MARNNIDLKVSYVRITEFGMEFHKDHLLKDLNSEDRKDIKAMSFLPINFEGVLDISKLLDGFSLLENLYLPSMMTTSIDKVKGNCPMIKSIIILSRDPYGHNLDNAPIRVMATEEEGNNDSQFIASVSYNKDGKQVYLVNPIHIDNHSVISEEKTYKRLTLSDVNNYISGEKGLMSLINDVNKEIEDERYHIDIAQETLESLLYLFVENGLTFEQFSIDFSKLYDKIESYKSIAKSVNQVSIKEEVEACVIETYQRSRELLYQTLLEENAKLLPKLIRGVDKDFEDMLLTDLTRYVVNISVMSPNFDEDYKSGTAIDDILNDIAVSLPRNVKSSKYRDLLKKYLNQVVANLKSNKEDLFVKIDKCLEEKTSIDWTKETFAKKFGLDLSKKQPAELANEFVESLTTKNFSALTKDDVFGIITNIQKEIGNGEVRSKELVEIIKRVVSQFPTKEEIYSVLVDFIADKGYSAIRYANA